MNISVVGHEHPLKAHFANNVKMALEELGHVVEFFDCNELRKSNRMKYLVDYGLDEYADFILVDQNDYYWKRTEFSSQELQCPVLYYQKYVHRRFSVFYPDVAFFFTSPMQEFCERIFAKVECAKVKRKEVLHPAVNPELYRPKKKIYDGISWFGSKNESEHQIETVELLSIAQRTVYRWEEKMLRKQGSLRMFETPCPTEQYREILPQCEAFWMSIPRGQYVSRMLLEAMACKTLCVFELQSERHEQVLKDMGFENYVHYVGLDDLKQVDNVFEVFSDDEIKTIVDDAYDVVMNNHTYLHRAKQIIEVYKQLN